MWFNLDDLVKNKTIPLATSATSATSATLEPDNIKPEPQSSKVAKVAEHDNQKFEFDAAVKWVELPEHSPGALMVVCFTPTGKAIQIEAKDQEHAEFLERMNLKSTNT
jgi:hypothetical protein